MSKYSVVNDLDDDIFDDKDQDYMLALQLQMQIEFEDESDFKRPTKSYSSPQKVSNEPIIDPQWDLIDPCPDIRAMFQEFDKKYFWNTLGSCIVEWSKRMTICAGIFYLREGGIIRLSEPLLKFRPRKDLVETLLHEMIHAYLYLTRNYKDRGEHGDEFKGHMNRINRLASTSITVYHSFHDEVNHARQHVWRCTGTCRTLAPYYGYVKRSMNRAPGKNDTWWSQHEKKCSGVFEKVSEPENFKDKSKKADSTIAKVKIKSEATTSGTQNTKIKAIKSDPNTTSILKHIKRETASTNSQQNNDTKIKSEPYSQVIKSEPTTSSQIIKIKTSKIDPNSQIVKSEPTTSSQIIKAKTSKNDPNVSKQIKTEPTSFGTQNKTLDLYFKNDKFQSSPTNSQKLTNNDLNKSKSLADLVKQEPSSQSNDIKSDYKKRKSADDELSPKKNFKPDDDIKEIVTIKAKTIKLDNNDIIVLDDDNQFDIKSNLVDCPICFKKFHSDLINSHVNSHF